MGRLALSTRAGPEGHHRCPHEEAEGPGEKVLWRHSREADSKVPVLKTP